MTNPKRLLRKAGLALAMTASLVGVTGVATSVQAEDITIKYWALVNPNYEPFIEKAKAEFKKTHPNVTIVMENFGDAYYDALRVALVGSDPPDVFFNYAGERAASLAREGLALDITDYGGEPGGFKSFVSDAILTPFVFGGRNYGIPTEQVSVYGFYNTTFFNANNLTPPATFSELLGLCKAIRTIDSNIVPMPLGNDQQWTGGHYITILNERVLGLDALNADYDLSAPTDKLFANPGYVEAWKKLLEIQDAGCFTPAPNATSNDVAVSLFSSGASPMIFCGTWCMETFNPEGRTDYGLFRFPRIEGGGSDGSTNIDIINGNMVAAKSKHPREAVEWATLLVNDEFSKEFARVRGLIPSNPKLVSELTDVTEQFKWVANDLGSLKGTFNVTDITLEANLSAAFKDMVTEVLNRTKTPEQAAEYVRTVALASKAAAGK